MGIFLNHFIDPQFRLVLFITFSVCVSLFIIFVYFQLWNFFTNYESLGRFQLKVSFFLLCFCNNTSRNYIVFLPFFCNWAPHCWNDCWERVRALVSGTLWCFIASSFPTTATSDSFSCWVLKLQAARHDCKNSSNFIKILKNKKEQWFFFFNLDNLNWQKQFQFLRFLRVTKSYSDQIKIVNKEKRLLFLIIFPHLYKCCSCRALY